MSWAAPRVGSRRYETPTKAVYLARIRRCDNDQLVWQSDLIESYERAKDVACARRVNRWPGPRYYCEVFNSRSRTVSWRNGKPRSRRKQPQRQRTVRRWAS